MSPHNAPDKTKLSDAEWATIAMQLKTISGIHRHQSAACRRFVEAVLWVLQVGGQWRSLPMEGISADACLADKGYDSDGFLTWLQERGIKAVIPAKANRKEPRACDW